VLELRFGLADDQPKTLREIGEVMGLSRERVRQIESRALNKLRRSHQKHSLQGFLR
jgi:RNA polymerase primary sigma factor